MHLKLFIGLVFGFWLGVFGQEWVQIDSIKISGNVKTKEKIILRELSIYKGSRVLKHSLDSVLTADKQKLMNRNIFNEVSIVPVYKTTQMAEVEIVVKERWYFFPGLDVGWADRNFNEWWYTYNHDLKRLKYGVYAGHDNVTGNADKARLTFITGFLKQYGLGYSRPYIDKKQRYGAEAAINYLTYNNIQANTFEDKFVAYRRTEAVRKNLNGYLGISNRTGFFKNQIVQLGFAQNTIADSVAIFNPDYLANGRTKLSYVFGAYEFRWDHRDDVNYPTKGTFFSLKTTQLLWKDFNMTNVSLNITKYYHLSKNINFTSSFRARTSTPKNQPYLLRQNLGFGHRTEFVRGYEQYIVDGQSYFLLKNNLTRKVFERKLALKNMPIKQFNSLPISLYARASADLGYVANNQPMATQSLLSNKLLKGGGIGIDIVTWYSTVLQLNFYVNQMGEFRFSPKTRFDF